VQVALLGLWRHLAEHPAQVAQHPHRALHFHRLGQLRFCGPQLGAELGKLAFVVRPADAIDIDIEKQVAYTEQLKIEKLPRN
jgi:hypothetical protein